MYLFIISLYNEKEKGGAIAIAIVALLHWNGILIKQTLWKLSQIKEISPKSKQLMGVNFVWVKKGH